MSRTSTGIAPRAQNDKKVVQIRRGVGAGGKRDTLCALFLNATGYNILICHLHDSALWKLCFLIRTLCRVSIQSPQRAPARVDGLREYAIKEDEQRFAGMDGRVQHASKDVSCLGGLLVDHVRHEGDQNPHDNLLDVLVHYSHLLVVVVQSEQ